MDGGDTAMVVTDGSGRCSGRSPFMTSMVIRFGVTTTTQPSGIMDIPTSMPVYLGLTAMTILPVMAVIFRDTRAEAGPPATLTLRQIRAIGQV